MRTSTRVALAVAGCLALAAPAHAIDVHDAHDGNPAGVPFAGTNVRLSTGASAFTCTGMTLTTAGIANGAADPQGVAVDTAYAGCSTPLGAAAVACTGSTLDVDDIAANDQADLDLDLPNQACTLSIAGCTVKAPDDGAGATAEIDGAVSDRGAGVPAPAVLTRTSVPFSAAGFFCGLYGIPASGGFAWFESTAGGNVALAESGNRGGTELDLRPNVG